MFLLLKSFKSKFAVLFLAIISIIFIVLSIKWHFYRGERVIQSDMDFKGCMTIAGNLYKNESEIFFKELNKCIKMYIPIKEKHLDRFEGNKKTEKFMPLVGKEEDCKWLTIGIDESIKVEMNFKEKYPQCSIFGADPYPPKNFSSIGKVFSFGVDLDNTFNTAIVLINDTKVAKEVQIDIEGYEYKLLESLVGNGRYANAGLTFCQISVNLHDPETPSTHPAVKDLNRGEFILSFLQQSSPYIPIYNVPYNNHQKITFINIRDPLCEIAFKFSKYF